METTLTGMKPQVIIFDLNGTLLDLSALDSHFVRLFGSKVYREKWFEQLQVLWMTTIACGTFQPFEKLAKASLQMLAAKESVPLSRSDQSAVLSNMTELPAFPDTAVALGRLRTAGYRLAVLTNSALKSAKAQLKHAGIAGAFDAVFSAGQVERYKPSPEPYLYAAEQLGVKPRKMLLVAAHAWDIEGAHQAGLATAFLARPRQVLSPAGSLPDYVFNDLHELTERIS